LTTPQPRKVVITTAGAGDVADRLGRLDEDVEVVERFELADISDERALAEGLAGAWAVVAGSEHYTRGVFEALSDLRAIVRFGVGYDAIDLAAAGDHGVAVLTTPGANAEAVADMALALMLSCLRQLPERDAAVRNGTWRTDTLSRDLAQATVALVGLGAIGRAVARRLRGFGCELLVVEPHPDAAVLAEMGLATVPLDDALRRADVVTLHAALTPHTHHLIGAREIALMPAHAVIVNTSRGGLIDEAALVDALAHGRLGGAGLDVFEHEPLPADDPLLSLSKVVVAGHVSAWTPLAIATTSAAVVERLQQLLRGELPAGCLSAPRTAGAPG
jgi:phosphoglycerate dehydrogenase-like enzyme